ncbi:MAG: hypothetical protein QOF67_1074 [Mycobacterium sp.]|jgi:hypothetical protein|nr:hypothetical protein [Mycobacterium sp.]
MTDMATTFSPALDESRDTLVTSVPISTDTQALITEQQVLFSTAAAEALPSATTRRWSDTVSTAVRAMFAAPERRPARQHYPKRHAWLDNALMSREMDRL